jgi:hypothetical protein
MLLYSPMKLVYTQPHGKHIKAGDEVKINDKVLTFRGELVKVVSFNKPHKPSSIGKIIIETSYGNQNEVYVSVIDAKWTE